MTIAGLTNGQTLLGRDPRHQRDRCQPAVDPRRSRQRRATCPGPRRRCSPSPATHRSPSAGRRLASTTAHRSSTTRSSGRPRPAVPSPLSSTAPRSRPRPRSPGSPTARPTTCEWRRSTPPAPAPGRRRRSPTPFTTPSAPTIAVTPGDGALTVDLTPGSNGGSAVTAYEYRLGAAGHVDVDRHAGHQLHDRRSRQRHVVRRVRRVPSTPPVPAPPRTLSTRHAADCAVGAGDLRGGARRPAPSACRSPSAPTAAVR